MENVGVVEFYRKKTIVTFLKLIFWLFSIAAFDNFAANALQSLPPQKKKPK